MTTWMNCNLSWMCESAIRSTLCIQLYHDKVAHINRRSQDAQVLEGATALALSAILCYAGSRVAGHLGVPGALIPAATGACSLDCPVTA